VLVCGLILLSVVFCFWNSTSDDASWYVKRLDFGRPSVQHRLAAWKASLKIMRDHPLGTGWNNVVKIYQDSYFPPENGAAAILTNDYLRIGTELGIAALLCFACNIFFCLFSNHRIMKNKVDIQAVCLSGSCVFVITFCFDGGLFKLPTATLFWVLLELGSGSGLKVKKSAVSSNDTLQ
jgi:O-antigen ligase